MALGFRVREAAAESDEFTYIGKVVTFRVQDSDAEHKKNIGADEDTRVDQIVLEIEGVSVERLCEDGKWRFSGDIMSKTGEYKKGRNYKAWYLLAPIIAPDNEEDARNVLDEKGRQVFVTRGKNGSEVVLVGLGYDDEAPDFPEKLEGRVFKIAHRWVGFGKNKDTGEEIRGMVPILLEEMPKGYVYEGEVSRISCKDRATTPREAGEDSPEPEPADTTEFFAAIEGRRLRLADLHEAVKGNPALMVDPYRTLIATTTGRQALVEKGFISLDDDKTIVLEDLPDLDMLVELAETVAEAAAQ